MAVVVPAVLLIGLAEAAAQTIERVSVSSRGMQGNDASGEMGGYRESAHGLAVSSDGRFVAFSSTASNLVAGDRGLTEDVFVRDRLRGTTRRVARHSVLLSMTPSGRYLLVVQGRDIRAGDRNGGPDPFLVDRITGRFTRVNVTSTGRPIHPEPPIDGAVSNNGRFAAFTFYLRTRVSGDLGPREVFVRDLWRGTTRRLTRHRSGVASVYPVISGSGRFVGYVRIDSNAGTSRFVLHDLRRGTRRVMAFEPGLPSMSASGRWLAITSYVPPDPADPTRTGRAVVRLRDLRTGAELPVGPPEMEHGIFSKPAISRDGSKVAFFWLDRDPVANVPRGDRHLYVFDRRTGSTTRVAGVGDSGTLAPALSFDGRWVAFPSWLRTLVPGDTNERVDVFLAELAAPPAQAAAQRSTAARPYDFDGDGRQNLLIGLPGYQVGGAPAAGALLELAGTRRGVEPLARRITRGSPGMPGGPRGDDEFGISITSADFDRDGYADASALAARWADHDGGVMTIYGSRGGLASGRAELIQVPNATPWDVLTVGDVNGDTYSDLIIGANFAIRPAPTSTERPAAGIIVLPGSAEGLGTMAPQTTVFPVNADSIDEMRLAVGDINVDGFDDIVHASPGSPVVSVGEKQPGHLGWCQGGPEGLAACHTLRRTGPGPTAVAVGDVNGDGHADIVTGVAFPRYVDEESEKPPGPGVVEIWRGRAGGPRSRPVGIGQDDQGVPGTPEARAEFGTSLAVGHVDRDRFEDMIIGAPGSGQGTGRVILLRGGRDGHARIGNTAYIPTRRAGLPGARAFGARITALDFTGDGRVDLGVSAPLPDRRAAVAIIRGRGDRFARQGWQRLTAGSTGLGTGVPRSRGTIRYDFGTAFGMILGRSGGS